MKKPIAITLVYIALVFGICVIVAARFTSIPPLISGDRIPYILLNGLYTFLSFLPGICLGGFVIACAIHWQKGSGNSRSRFSRAMLSRFRFVLFSSLAFVLVLTLNEEMFKRLTTQKINSLREAPLTLAESLVIAGRFMTAEQPEIAAQFAERAVRIAPNDPAAISVLKQAQDAVEIAQEQRFYREINDNAQGSQGVNTGELRKKDEDHTILELIQMSDEAAQNKSWFDAHYWAQLAVDACDGTNTNLQAAMQRANYAWKMLSEPPGFDNSQEQAYYKQKKDAYEAFVRGDYLKAYYSFITIQNNYPESDPDVEKFLALSQEQVENQYFFFDETQYMRDITNGSEVYFMLNYPDGSKNVFFISNTMDMRRQGGLVSYLENLYVIHYDENGNFGYSLYVPFAKAVATPISEFGSVANRQALGISSDWEYVPVITLQSVDRNTEGLISVPEYSFSVTGLTEEIARDLGLKTEASPEGDESSDSSVQDSGVMILPMSFSDFHSMGGAAAGAGEMALWTLYRFIPNAQSYGFSGEAFTQNFVQRITFPFILLIMFVFSACMGWNYRIESPDAIFKFRWLLLIPIFGLIMIAVFDVVLYFFNMIDDSLVSRFGGMALPAAFALYIVLFAAGVILFLSRKE